jgi:UDPglucose 6-dehydrogenase
MDIVVVGAGYVGLVSAVCFAELGHFVTVVDNDEAKIKGLNTGHVPIHEELLPELLARHTYSRICFSTDIQNSFRRVDIAFITVGTPPALNGEADLSYVEAVARELALSLEGYKVVVEKSTVPARTCEAVERTMLLYGAEPGSFSVASNPEFLREGTAVSDFLFPDRIVIGADCERSRCALKEVYRPLLDGTYYQREDAIPGPRQGHPARLISTSVKSAELIKHASNAFLAMKISFINAVANICESVDADVREVCEGIGSDSRIGHRFLRPGVGYGGSCFPKDVLAFRAVAREAGYDFKLLTAVMEINAEQKQRFLKKVREALWNLRGKHLAVLGLAFKDGTDDVRDSPAIDIVSELLSAGATITAFDPAAMERAATLSNLQNLSFASSAYEACSGADALLVLTEWREFSELDLSRIKDLLRLPILLDGKNIFDPAQALAAGLHYHGIGSPQPRWPEPRSKRSREVQAVRCSSAGSAATAVQFLRPLED